MQRPDLAAVLDHYDIEYLVGRNSQVIRCPSPQHEDFIKSCSIDLEEGVLNCFGCSFAGSSIDLIMALEGVSVAGAFEFGAAFVPGASHSEVPSEPRFGKRVLPRQGNALRYRNRPSARRRRRPDAGA